MHSSPNLPGRTFYERAGMAAEQIGDCCWVCGRVFETVWRRRFLLASTGKIGSGLPSRMMMGCICKSRAQRGLG